MAELRTRGTQDRPSAAPNSTEVRTFPNASLLIYRDIIDQHLPEITGGIMVPPQTLTGWMEGKGEPTSEQAQKILDFLKEKVGRGPEV
jgi:hypothetical protein